MTFWVAGAAVAGAAISSSAAGDAADQQAASSQAALGENAREFDKIQTNQQPWMQAGTTALGKLQTGVDTPLDPSSVTLDPGYKFGLDQGLQAQNRQIAAAGGRISGASLKAATQYGTNYATTGYTDAYNRANQARSDRLNRLAALAGIGQTATQNVGQAAQTSALASGQILTAQGNASGAAALAQGNIWGNAGNQIASLYGRNPSGFTVGGAQGSLSQTGIGGSGFGTGLAYGNQDYGSYI